MRIAIVSGTFHPEAGGPPTYLHRLCAGLVARGHRVRVATFGEPAPASEYPYPVVRVSRRQPIPARLARLAVLALQDALGADLLFASDYGLPPMLANRIARRPFVIKIVSDFAWEFGIRHGLISPQTSIEAFQRQPAPPALEAVRWLQRRYVKAADAVIVPSAYLGALVRGWGVAPERLHVIYNAVEAAPARPSRQDIRARLGLPRDARLIATVARLVPWKGVDVLLRAIALLVARCSHVGLVVVGDGVERPRLERLARELGLERAVVFTGEATREEVASYLRGADLFALASSYEGFSHVLLEALAAGLPAVATAVGGNIEVLRDGENGLLVPTGDPAALAAALERVLADADLRSRLARAGQDTARRYSWDAVIDETVALFQRVAGARRGR